MADPVAVPVAPDTALDPAIRALLDRPVNEVLAALGLPPVPTAPETPPQQELPAAPKGVPEAPQVPGFDVAGLVKPMTDLLSTFGSGSFEGLDPSAALSGASKALEQGVSMGMQAISQLSSVWQGPAATAATGKGLEAATGTGLVAEQGAELSTAVGEAAAVVGTGEAELQAIIDSFMAVIAALGLLEPHEVLVLRLGGLPCGAIDALQTRVGLVSAPIRRRHTSELESGDELGGRHVRAAAQVEPDALPGARIEVVVRGELARADLHDLSRIDRCSFACVRPTLVLDEFELVRLVRHAQRAFQQREDPQAGHAETAAVHRLHRRLRAVDSRVVYPAADGGGLQITAGRSGRPRLLCYQDEEDQKTRPSTTSCSLRC